MPGLHVIITYSVFSYWYPPVNCVVVTNKIVASLELDTQTRCPHDIVAASPPIRKKWRHCLFMVSVTE